MSRKPSPSADNPAQRKRFIDMAREVEVDEREGAFNRAFDRIKDNAKSPKPLDRHSRRNGKPTAS